VRPLLSQLHLRLLLYRLHPLRYPSDFALLRAGWNPAAGDYLPGIVVRARQGPERGCQCGMPPCASIALPRPPPAPFPWTNQITGVEFSETQSHTRSQTQTPSVTPSGNGNNHVVTEPQHNWHTVHGSHSNSICDSEPYVQRHGVCDPIRNEDFDGNSQPVQHNLGVTEPQHNWYTIHGRPLKPNL